MRAEVMKRMWCEMNFEIHYVMMKAEMLKNWIWEKIVEMKIFKM